MSTKLSLKEQIEILKNDINHSIEKIETYNDVVKHFPANMYDQNIFLENSSQAKLSRLKTDFLKHSSTESSDYGASVSVSLESADQLQIALTKKIDLILRDKIKGCIKRLDDNDISIKDLSQDKVDHELIKNGYAFYYRNSPSYLDLKLDYEDKFRKKIENIIDSSSVPPSVASGLLQIAKPEYRLLNDVQVNQAEQYYQKLVAIQTIALQPDITPEVASSCVAQVATLNEAYGHLHFEPANISKVINELNNTFKQPVFMEALFADATVNKDWAYIEQLKDRSYSFTSEQIQRLEVNGYDTKQLKSGSEDVAVAHTEGSSVIAASGSVKNHNRP